ncbi:MAG TPA: DNA mismatch repair endonuclease MutL [Pyrinomonadaceae bacterium]|jgi:DNA mismatch repair protein MutL|nr:DNA mismatch repair endonuclease MutL [Pyrinomonadaceae bacterium]
MSKIRVLSDHVANQIAAGEVVERPASVAKELVENAIDAGARRIVIDVESGGRRLLKVSDDGDGMVRDDAVLAFERHATSKITNSEDLASIATLGFRGEALASIGSVARVELTTKTEDGASATRVTIEGGKMRDVKDAAHPRGTTIAVRDLFFNIPARRKFLKSEATESFHLTNLVTHYALAHPEIAFTLTNNGREVLRVAPASDLRERAYQVFGAEFLDNLLAVGGGPAQIARVTGFVSAPRDRRTSRDAQYLFVNGRFVRDRLIARALSDGYRAVLPHGVYPAALLFIEIPLEEVDVNVHPAKTEVRFRRAAAVSDAVREAVRSSLASAGYVRANEPSPATFVSEVAIETESTEPAATMSAAASDFASTAIPAREYIPPPPRESPAPATQPRIEFSSVQDEANSADTRSETTQSPVSSGDTQVIAGTAGVPPANSRLSSVARDNSSILPTIPDEIVTTDLVFPPLNSAEKFTREVAVESLSNDIRPLGQLDESFIIATDNDGLLLIDQHVAHERVLFDKYRALESVRQPESQQLLIPETFDLTPAQAAVFDVLAEELESYGFDLMRLSGRTVAIKATPADLPAGEARNMLAELLDTVDAEKKGSARETLRDDIAASLACHAAIKVNMSLTPEKMRWLIDRLLKTSSPTTCPHGRPVILRLTTKDILKGFHRI